MTYPYKYNLKHINFGMNRLANFGMVESDSEDHPKSIYIDCNKRVYKN